MMEEIEQRLALLRNFYNRLSLKQPKDGSWDWWLRSEIMYLENQKKISAHTLTINKYGV